MGRPTDDQVRHGAFAAKLILAGAACLVWANHSHNGDVAVLGVVLIAIGVWYGATTGA